MTIPVTPHDDADIPLKLAASPPASVEQPGSKGHLLMVEDNDINRKLGAIMLHRLGYTVDLVNNGREALAQVFTRPYQAVLMDCEMPELDGYAATRAIRKIEQATPGNPHIPVIALTANVLSGAEQKCLAAGMDHYLSKPITIGQLKDALSRFLP